MGYDVAEFAELGLHSEHPVDLGSRCTVFMNSSVKQSQKEGASVEDISAGLSISVVKNALYKVIRANDADDLGKKIVVQGGTFYNDAILRAFEKEIGRNVIRPSIAGLMGAFGCALYAKANQSGETTCLGPVALNEFSYQTYSRTCQGCGNHCELTINHFSNGEELIAGNRCERPLNKDKKALDLPNAYLYKQQLITNLKKEQLAGDFPNGTVGMPLGLNVYEMYPFWTASSGTSSATACCSHHSARSSSSQRGSTPSRRTPSAILPSSSTATLNGCWKRTLILFSIHASATISTRRSATTTTTAQSSPSIRRSSRPTSVRSTRRNTSSVSTASTIKNS